MRRKVHACKYVGSPLTYNRKYLWLVIAGQIVSSSVKSTLMKYTAVLLWTIFVVSTGSAQVLQPGFNRNEYLDMLRVTARQVDTPWTNVKVPAPHNYNFVYRSDIVGLDNMWDLWIHKTDKIAVLSLRGTTANPESWLENFYAAMVPAQGALQLDNKRTFTYKLASNPKAAVHIGWLLGMAFLSDDILRKTDSLYKKGYKDFIIMGHSQGGALAYMFRSHIYYLQQEGKLPEDIRVKTYNSAAPKPGNLYYAYDYEHINYGGWAYTVVNADDWVPETPLSLQTIADFNTVNPFTNAGEMLSKQPFPKNVVLKLVYNNLRRPAAKLLKRYQRYLGDEAYKMVKKQLNEYRHPALYNSNNYMRAGTPVVLTGNDVYRKEYPDKEDQVFIHHFPEPYYYLAGQLPE